MPGKQALSCWASQSQPGFQGSLEPELSLSTGQSVHGEHMWAKGTKGIGRNPCFPPTTWIPRIKARPSGLAANTLPTEPSCWPSFDFDRILTIILLISQLYIKHLLCIWNLWNWTKHKVIHTFSTLYFLLFIPFCNGMRQCITLLGVLVFRLFVYMKMHVWKWKDFLRPVTFQVG